MGTWDLHPFASDNALDFVASVSGVRGAVKLREKLEQILSSPAGAYLDAGDAAEALACSELVAAAYGWCASYLPESLKAHLPALRKALQEHDRELALSALSRLGGSSELRDLWEEADPAAWDEISADLARRLVAPIRGLPKAQRPKRLKVQPGDIVLLPVAPNASVPGKVLVVSQKYPGYILLGVYRAVVSDPGAHGELPVAPASVICTPVSLVSEQVWKRVGHVPPTPAELNILPTPEIPNINTAVICFAGAAESAARELVGING